MDKFLKMASAIYEASLDMDFADYGDTREQDINFLASALKKMEEYAAKDNDFLALFNALSMIYEEV